MHIFGRKSQEHHSELTLVQEQRTKYDFWAVPAKALLIFLLVYGALGGFLSAYEIEYNKGLCMLGVFGLALILSAVYETRRRWLTNLASIVLFGMYLYIAATNYWVINSGYYAILNRINTVARQKLNLVNSTEYVLRIEEQYTTVTVFALFLSMVGVILLNIQLQNKCSLFKILLVTFTPYIIPLYFELSPSLIYLLFLFVGYVAVAVLQGGRAREYLSRQIRYTLPLAALVGVLLVRSVTFLLPETAYNSMVSASAAREASEARVSNLVQFGLMSLFGQGSTGAGISGGRLSRGAAVMPSYETDLIVRYTPYSFAPVYLKAFTGRDYQGMIWTRADDEGADDGRMKDTVESRRQTYAANPDRQGRGVMSVERVGASKLYEYRPYYTGYASYDAVWTKDAVESSVYQYYYYPAVGWVYDSCARDLTADAVDEAYLSVPASCRKAVQRVCNTAEFEGTAEEIAAQITDYFQENYSYTLRPGWYYGSPDYITHFLLESRRGYCSHFASAATMLFRNMGVPARYAEGYAFSYADVVENGILVEGEAYEDYYDGYAPLGKTALVEMEIPDAYAHAWVEIYVENKGWIVVDPTPSSAEENTTSFWDAFLNADGDDSDLDIGENNLGTYLETALGGASVVLLVIVILFAVIFLARRILRWRRERALPEREQVQLEYQRIQRYLAGKSKNYRVLRTLREQLDWIRAHYSLEIAEEQEQALYQAFFAGETACDCGELRRELKRLRTALRWRPLKKQ
ncbi:MAG: transglutaminase-like domain-containing protein [Acetatifactor sp.]|nr:transglutaminase-like domain-containing protein [Acetatifactor sp.]